MSADKKKLMKRITDKVGRDQAIEMVLQAYNTELITTWLSRLQQDKPLGGPTRHDHLADALERVATVCDMAE